MPYEQGMKIDYDPKEKHVIITFRGERVTLPEKYESAEMGKAAGEKYCRRHGWKA